MFSRSVATRVQVTLRIEGQLFCRARTMLQLRGYSHLSTLVGPFLALVGRQDRVTESTGSTSKDDGGEAHFGRGQEGNECKKNVGVGFIQEVDSGALTDPTKSLSPSILRTSP